jgi:hypothetical protein
MPANFATPEARLVGGNPFVSRTVPGKNGKPDRQEFFVAIAIPKTDPEWPALEAVIRGEAKASFPQFFQGDRCTLPKFAFKITDGDGFDDRGKANAEKEGYAGCWVLRMSTGFAPTCYGADGRELIGQGIRPGDYVRVSGSVSGNGSTQSPGVFVHPHVVKLWRPGPEIKLSTVSRDDPFGAAPSYSTVAAAPPPPSTGPVMTNKAAGVPYEAFIAQGWTDAQLRDQKFML